MSIQQIFRDHTAKLMARVFVLVVAGLALLALGDPLETRLAATDWRLLPGVLIHLGTALIVASGVILVIDVSLRKDFLEDIRQVVESLQVRERIPVRRVVYERKELDPVITSDLRTAAPGAVIRVVGIAQKDFFTDQPGHVTVRERIKDGCILRVLLLHPESTLLGCVQNLSKYFGSPDIRLSMRAALAGTVKRTFLDVQGMLPAMSGSLEVRLHKDVFSTLFVYIGHATLVCGTYMSHRRGRLSPAFVVDDAELRTIMTDHFERLWDVSESHQLCKVSPQEMIDNFAEYE